MAILAPIRDRLCYPAGYMPRIDPTHPAVRASGKFLRFSGIASGSNFLRIDKLPLKGTIAATISAGLDGTIGPLVRNAATTGKVTFAGNSTVAPTSCTVAGIFVLYSSSASLFPTIIGITSAVASVPMLWISNSTGDTLHLGADNGLVEVDSGIVIATNTPYFAVASYPVNSTGFVNFAVTNLRTAQIRLASIANTFAATASNGTYCVAGNGASDPADIGVAAAMYSTAGLNKTDVYQWAGDPWAFWYPDITAMDDFLVGGSTPIPPSATPLGASLMPMMGVG